MVGFFFTSQVGIASVWYQGNPCNMHLLSLGEDVKKEVDKEPIHSFWVGLGGLSHKNMHEWWGFKWIYQRCAKVSLGVV